MMRQESEAMQALAQLLLLLMLGLAGVVVLLAAFRRRSSSTRRSQHKLSRPAPTPPPTTVVRDPAVVRTMIFDHADAFSNRPMAHFPEDFAGTHSINTVPYGPMWRALRGNLTAGIFHPTRLGLLAPLQREAVETLVDGLLSRGAGEVVVRDTLHAAVFALVVRLCFGEGVVGERRARAMEREVRKFVFTFVQDSALLSGLSLLGRLVHWRRWRRYSGTFGRVSKLVLPGIAARKVSRGTNNGGGGGIRSYVDSLLDLEVPDNADDDDDDATAAGGGRGKRPLTDREMVRLVFEFLGANTESVVSCVEWTLARLVTRPEVQEKLRREIPGDAPLVVSEERLRGLPYLRAVILESLRLHAPVPLMLRTVAAEDAAAACGEPLPPAAVGGPVRFVVKIRDVGRSRRAWTEPDEFRPERFLAGGEAEDVGAVPGPKEVRMVPFGAGRRYCPGVAPAMVHVASFLAALVREFEWALPADSDGVDLAEFSTFFMVMKKPLRARITPCRACAAARE